MSRSSTLPTIALADYPDTSPSASARRAVPITATVVPDTQRLSFLPRHFAGGVLMLEVESAVYSHMRVLCPTYQGGYWVYADLSNGGALMYPNGFDRFNISVDGNGFDAAVGAEVAGIIATTFALNGLIWRGFPMVEPKYEQLLEYIAQHSECATIRRALD